MNSDRTLRYFLRD